MKELNIAIDSGKHSTKALARIGDHLEKVVFRTKMEEVKNLGIDITPGSYLVEYNGKSFLVGDMISENTCNYQLTKQTIDHKLCMFVAICKILDKSDILQYGLPKINIAINTPISTYINSSLKNEYENFLTNNNGSDIISIKVNNKAYAFRIKSITLLPESLGPIYIRTQDFRYKRINVIDFGSLNTSFCTFNNLIPQLNSMCVSNSGVNVLRGQLAEKLTALTGTLVSDSDVEQILQDGYLNIGGINILESKDEIDKVIKKHIAEIFNYALSRGISFNNSTLIFVGGGSILLSKYILEYHPFAIIESDAQFTNCSSFLQILEVKYGQK